MTIKRMLKEEWRMHSKIYTGPSFAMFPVLVFLLTAGFAMIIQNYSTLQVSVLSEFLPVFGLFLGLGVGAVGFSSSDVLKNVLGRTNFLLYSSRTLPISHSKLLAEFVVKDLIYYTLFFIIPVLSGIYVISGFSFSSLMILPAFAAGILASLTLSRSSLRLPSLIKPVYSSGSPLTQKSILDIERSSGGLLKIVFSLTLLSGFYWFLVLNFPLAKIFLQQPMISFSVLIGTISITIYNWVNRFDSFEDYNYLPVSKGDLLEAKQKAFVRIAFPLLIVLTLAPYLFYRGNILLATVVALSTSTYALGSASRIFLLDPNTRIYSSYHFTKLIILNSLVVVPLLMSTVFGLPDYVILVSSGFAATAGLALILQARKCIG